MQRGVDPSTAVTELIGKRINVTGSYEASTRLDFESRKLPAAVIRASVAYCNTEDEIDSLVKAIKELKPVYPLHTASSLLLGGGFRRR